MGKPRGFTLIEMIAVIVITGVLVAMVGLNISRPIDAFTQTARRAALVDEAETALQRLTRESRLALPNSIRLASGDRALEFLRTRSGGRYRAVLDPGDPVNTNALNFLLNNDDFDVIGVINEFGQICTGGSGNCGGASPTSTTACLADTRVDCLVIFNTGQPSDCSGAVGTQTNAYCGDNVAGVENIDTLANTIEFIHDGLFPFPSPQQRFHIIDTPVSFICDIVAGTLTRYDGYPIVTTQPTVAAPPATSGRVLAMNVTDCRFDYDAGTATRAALVSITLTVADSDASSEQIRLFQQAHVPNVP